MNATQQNTLGPLTLEPLLVERIWGVDALHSWYRQPAAGQVIGEVWLTAKECLVQGIDRTLDALAAANPQPLDSPKDKGFPLLIKLLYPREKLSVQVHPNDAQAFASLGEPHGKTECWYVLSAEPGAQVALGLAQPMEADEVRRSIEDGSIEKKLRYVDVKAGDMVFVDAGTVHAIGPGVVMLETQQYSDITYRLWDYGRPRELHLDAGVAVIRNETAAGLVEATEMDGFTRLLASQYFTVDSFKAEASRERLLGHGDRLQILIALGDGASVVAKGATHSLKAGHAVLLPSEGVNYELLTPAGVEVIRIFDFKA